MRKTERYQQLIAYFEQAMPQAKTELDYSTPFQLLVATMLSAQCTDKRVNMVTPALFAAYPDAQAMARASADEIFHYVKSVSYPNSKSQHIADMARMLVSEYGGEVPDSVDQLTRLPGVGRKTANVVVSVVWGQPALAVDTHVFRVANRIGLTHNSRSPLETERILTQHIPADKIPVAHHWLILHGRYVCQARKPHCTDCGIAHLCAYHAKELAKAQKKGGES